jgi:hypothetical protein
MACLAMQVGAMYTMDGSGRSRLVNEPGGGPAPRFTLWRTGAGATWRIRHDVPDDMAATLESLAREEGGRGEWPDCRAAYLRVLDAAHDAGGPAYRFPVQLPSPGIAARLRREEGALLRQMPGYLADVADAWDEREPRFVVVADGDVVSICNTVRLSDRAAEAGVDTVASFRGRGNAPMVVAAWAAAIRADGRTPFYSTSWENMASQAVARKVGLIQYASFYNVP